MTKVVKIIKICKEKTNDKYWHYINDVGGADGALCTGQVFRDGDIDAEYKEKHGKITCPDCIEKIKEFKAIKL